MAENSETAKKYWQVRATALPTSPCSFPVGLVRMPLTCCMHGLDAAPYSLHAHGFISMHALHVACVCKWHGRQRACTQCHPHACLRCPLRLQVTSEGGLEAAYLAPSIYAALDSLAMRARRCGVGTGAVGAGSRESV